MSSLSPYEYHLLRRLSDSLLIEKVLKVLYEEKEQVVKTCFMELIGPTAWEYIGNSFSVSLDYDNDVYITFMCRNMHREYVNKKLEEVFNLKYVDDLGDSYTEYVINSNKFLGLV